jgi:hypothetical protein
MFKRCGYFQLRFIIGLAEDLRAVLKELIESDGLTDWVGRGLCKSA